MSELNPYCWDAPLRALLVISIVTGSLLGALVGIEAAETAEQYWSRWSEITGSVPDFAWSELRGVHRVVDPN